MLQEVFSPSRIDPLHFSGFGEGRHIDMLRDDLIHPLVSGNKWRKLRYILEDMLAKGKKRLVTFGGAYSNHLVATAFAGKQFGIETHAFVRGDESREPNERERLCMELGMTLKHVSRSAYRNKEELYLSAFGADPLAEMVGEGGRHPLALRGAAGIISDLGDTYDYIVLSVGTGTTMEGMLKALSERKSATRLIGISSLKNNFELDRIMQPYTGASWRIEHGYHRGKYAHKDVELERFIESFHRETGIMTEFVYTGKMLMAIADMIESGKFEKGARIACVHTGGLFGPLQ